MHYYKFNIADWALHTAHLTLEEEAVYFRLINHYYDSEQAIPLETHSVIRRLRLGNHSDTVEVILSEFFTKTEKGYFHNRCEEILKDYRKTVSRNRKNAAKGGRPRKDVASSETQSVSSGIPKETESEPTGIPNQELRTTNHKPLVKDKNTSPSACSEVDQIFQSGEITKEKISEIRSIRKSNRGAAITARVAKALLKEFIAGGQLGWSLDAMLDEWASRGWKSFKAEWLPQKNQRQARAEQSQKIWNPQYHIDQLEGV